MSDTINTITIYQPWASLIVLGAKPYEFRGWAAPKWAIGKPLGIHASARPVKPDEVQDLLNKCRGDEWTRAGLIRDVAIPFLERVLAFYDRPMHDFVGVRCARCHYVYDRHDKSNRRCLIPDALSLPTLAMLGKAMLGEPTLNPIVDGAHLVADSDRSDHLNYGWPLTDIVPFEPPVPAKGMQGLWKWKEVAA